MKAIEVIDTIEEGCRVRLDEPVPAAVGERVRLIMLVGEDEATEQERLQAATHGGAFDFLKHPEEDLYTLKHGKPFDDARVKVFLFPFRSTISKRRKHVPPSANGAVNTSSPPRAGFRHQPLTRRTARYRRRDRPTRSRLRADWFSGSVDLFGLIDVDAERFLLPEREAYRRECQVPVEAGDRPVP
jgi:hypothetical protein